MGKRDLRMNRLIEILKSQNYVPIKEIAQRLQVSEMTIRRDLVALQQSLPIKNVNGVLVLNSDRENSPLHKEYNLISEAQVQNEVKALIGRFAATMIHPGDCVILDIGSTTEQLARFLPQDLECEVLCLTRNILNQLCQFPNVSIALPGGYYIPQTELFIGSSGINFIKSIRANKAFISAAGIHEDLGISCANSYEVDAKRAIMHSAQQHILVADSSKFGVVRSSYFCDLSDIHAVITDSGLSPQWRSLLQERGIPVYLV